ncbi:MAG TPA: flagellar hook-basal body complex protein FliE [Deltaproteobacteria bacterium]|nr:flagellar hook-basal body complex protein FliE [Deltaproteobacteria bacterium]
MSNLLDRVGTTQNFNEETFGRVTDEKEKTFNVKFGERLRKALEEIDTLQENADKLSKELAIGHNAPLHETMIALEKADISLRLFIQVRNKVVEAYREVMHMQF